MEEIFQVVQEEKEEGEEEVIPFNYQNAYLELKKSKYCLGSEQDLKQRFIMNKLVKLGKGGFGQVYKVQQKEDGKYYALKIVPQDKQDFEDYYEEVMKEVKVLEKLYHEFVKEFPPRYLVRSLGYYVHYAKDSVGNEKIQVFILQPKLECSVADLIKKKEVFTETEIIYFIIQIIMAMWKLKYIYRIQHRDIKPANILRYQKNWYGITDWGSSKFKFDSKHTLRGATINQFKTKKSDSNIIAGTVKFKAPEFKKLFLKKQEGQEIIVDGTQKVIEKSQEKSDVFSSGLSALSLLFPNLKISELNSYDSDGKQLAKEIQAINNPQLRELILKMTEWDYLKRFSIDECISFINLNFSQEIKEVEKIIQVEEFRNSFTQIQIEEKKNLIQKKIKEGRTQYNDYEYEQAYRETTNALEVASLFLPQEDVIYVKCLYLLGEILKEQGNYDHSVSIAELAYDISCKSNGKDDEISMDILFLLSRNMQQKGQYSKSLDMVEEVLKFRKSILGEDDIKVGSCYNQMGLNLERLQKWDEAIEFYLKYSQITEKIQGKQSKKYATSLNNIGAIYYYKEDYKQARTYYIEALEIFRKLIKNENNNLIAQILMNLGNLEYELGNFQEAEQYLDESFKITKVLFGEDHLETSYVLHNLGCLYQQQKKYKQSETHLLQAYEICKREFGENHQQTLTTKSFLDECRKESQQQ